MSRRAAAAAWLRARCTGKAGSAARALSRSELTCSPSCSTWIALADTHTRTGCNNCESRRPRCAALSDNLERRNSTEEKAGQVKMPSKNTN